MPTTEVIEVWKGGEVVGIVTTVMDENGGFVRGTAKAANPKRSFSLLAYLQAQCGDYLDMVMLPDGTIEATPGRGLQ